MVPLRSKSVSVPPTRSSVVGITVCRYARSIKAMAIRVTCPVESSSGWATTMEGMPPTSLS